MTNIHSLNRTSYYGDFASMLKTISDKARIAKENFEDKILGLKEKT